VTAQKVCWISIGLVAAAYLVDPINDPDLWWHIVAGRWIIAHQAVPHVEIWNQFSLGIPWKAYSWSNEIVLAAVNDSLGIMGLLALKVALGVFLVGTFMYCLGRVSNNMLFGAFLGLVVLGGCDITFTLRPQCFAWGLFAWMIYAAHTISDKPRISFIGMGEYPFDSGTRNYRSGFLDYSSTNHSSLADSPLNSRCDYPFCDSAYTIRGQGMDNVSKQSPPSLCSFVYTGIPASNDIYLLS
jgi:hypothetical protein